MRTCYSCNETLIGNYCNRCGYKLPNEPLRRENERRWIVRAVKSALIWLVCIVFLAPFCGMFVLGEDYEPKGGWEELVLISAIGLVVLLAGVAIYTGWDMTGKLLKVCWRIVRSHPLPALTLATGWWLYAIINEMIEHPSDLGLVQRMIPGANIIVEPMATFMMNLLENPNESGGLLTLSMVTMLIIMLILSFGLFLVVPTAWGFLLVRWTWQRWKKRSGA